MDLEVFTTIETTKWKINTNKSENQNDNWHDNDER